MAVGQRVIIRNDAHDRKRQAASFSHEMAHGLLNHPPMKILDPSGKRAYDREMQEAANWLGPALLISDKAAMHIAAGVAEASDRYGASYQLVRMRLNVTGAYRRLSPPLRLIWLAPSSMPTVILLRAHYKTAIALFRLRRTTARR